MNINGKDLVFLFLSTLAGYIEIGFLFLGYKLGFSILQITILGLIYQIGSLVPNPVNLSKLSICFISIACVSFCILNICLHAKEWLFWLVCLSNCTMTMSLQALRSQYRLRTTDFKKRIFRIAGFLCAPFLCLFSTIFVAIALHVLAAITPWNFKKNILERYEWNSACTLIFVHHLHYFFYVYFLVCTIAYLSENNHIFLYGGCFFAAGWIFYVLVPKISVSSSLYCNFMVGHLIVSLILFFGGFYSDKSEIIIFCWVLASPFAGTIFDVDTMFAKQYGRKTVRYAEAIGHVLGTILGIVVFSLLKDLKYVMYSSALIAFYNALQIKKYIVEKRDI